MEFKQSFLDRYTKLTDIDLFKKYSTEYLRRSIRVNTLKISVKDLKTALEKSWDLQQIPWCKEGFWIKHKTEKRRDIGNLKEHFLGYFYVQEAASMIPPIVLNPTQEDIVLDIAAAPGSKTTQLSALMNNKGLIVANDPDNSRIPALEINLQRCSCLNTIITNMKGQDIKGIEFDKILLDAPCSGTGTIRKSLQTLKMYNIHMIKKLSKIQKNLLFNAYNLLKPKGTLVYSTCSLEPEENEGVIDFLLSNTNSKIKEISLNIKRSLPILGFEGKHYNEDAKECLRLWPQDNDTEGFFVTKITKPD